MNASLSPKFRFGAESKNGPVSFAASQTKSAKSALTNAEFLRDSCGGMSLPFGPRDHSECPHRVTSRVFAGTDSDSLELVIDAAYRQVFGNCHVMEQERSPALEAQLKDGRLCVREFVRGLAKTEFYRTRFYSNVSPSRGIELAFKHVLGRPPLSQSEVSGCIDQQAREGFEAVIDSLVDSAEYTEVFGSDTVPYVRAFTSAAGMSMMNFVRIAAMEQNFAGSDVSRGSDSILQSNLASGSLLKINVPELPLYMETSTSWSGGLPPANYEKLWRGLAIVGGAHLAGMLVNVVAQMLGYNGLDRIPAMFLGL